MDKYNADMVRYADLINGCVFHGEQIVDAKYLKYCPRRKSLIITKESNTRIPGEKITDHLELAERERDVLRFHDCPGRKFYIACEAQSDADYTMPLREFSYDGIEYMDQLDTKAHKIVKKGRTKYLLPVLHIVLYHGWNRWLTKHSLQEMMDIPEALDKVRHMIPDYQTYIVDIHEQNPEWFRPEWADVFRLMGKSRKKEELKKYIEEHMEEIRGLSEDTRLLLAVLLEQYKITENGELEVNDVCEAWDGAMQMYAAEAAERTEKRMRQEMRRMQEEAEQEKEKLSERFRKLLAILTKEKKYDELERLSQEREYYQELFVAYHI